MLLLLPLALVPLLSTNQFYYSLTNQVLIGLIAALSVYIMLRMDLRVVRRAGVHGSSAVTQRRSPPSGGDRQ
mgnify:CR=1 FL=1